MKKYNSEVEYVKDVEPNVLKEDKEETSIIVLDKTEVLYCKEGTCFTDYCEENKIPYVQQSIFKNPGCIVGVKGNIFLGVKRKIKPIPFSIKFVRELCRYFHKKGLKVRTNGNDVLIDNFKVASGCLVPVKGYYYMGFQISINQDLELIKKVCNKPMVKIPKGLGEYGITTEEMVEFCENYFEKN